MRALPSADYTGPTLALSARLVSCSLFLERLGSIGHEGRVAVGQMQQQRHRARLIKGFDDLLEVADRIDRLIVDHQNDLAGSNTGTVGIVALDLADQDTPVGVSDAPPHFILERL